MHYAPKTKENQQHSHLIIRFALPSKNSESIKFNSLAPQRQDFILDTIDLSCESFNGSEETPGCTKSVTATRVIEFCNSQIIDWTVDPETDRRFLVWWAFNRPFLVSQTLFNDEYGVDLIVVVSGYRVDAKASRDG